MLVMPRNSLIFSLIYHELRTYEIRQIVQVFIICDAFLIPNHLRNPI